MLKLVLIILVVFVLLIIVVGPYIRKAYIRKITNPSITSPTAVNELYYSDYFSFQGADEHGFVLLAIDNNRWKNSNGYALDHFICMYAYGRWIETTGNKRFVNPSKELMTIPNDDVFTFTGSSEKGLIITSEVDKFQLQIAPLRIATTSRNGFAQFNMLSAPAVLNWQGREIKGRIIEEHLVMPHFSRKPFQWVKLSAASTFTSLYLSVEGNGDLYLHLKTGKGMNFIGGMNNGFIRFNDLEMCLNNMEWKTDSKRKWFYHLPVNFSILLSKSNPHIELTLETISRKDIANFFVAGFAMTAVKGNLLVDGKSYNVWGLGELIE